MTPKRAAITQLISHAIVAPREPLIGKTNVPGTANGIYPYPKMRSHMAYTDWLAFPRLNYRAGPEATRQRLSKILPSR